MNYSYVAVGVSNKVFVDIQNYMQNFRGYTCIGQFEVSLAAVEKVITLKPHLVFISIESLVNNNDFTFEIIGDLYQLMDNVPYFIGLADTPEHALQAIQSGISDYIIYPLHSLRIGKSLFRFEKRVLKTINNSICIKSFSDYQFLDLQDVCYLKADNNSTDFKLQNGKVITSFKTLKHFESKLPFNFLRIHKSFIVNINSISRVHLSKKLCYIEGNEVLPFSASYKSNIDYIIKKLEV